MVGPCWIGHVDSAVALVEFGEEEGAEMASTSARDGLNRGDTLVGDDIGGLAKD